METKLTRKQKIFAEEYVKCGNETEAAKRAGYRERSAYCIGSENMKKPDIIAYINELTASEDAKRIADAKEILEYFTAVMRGEIKDQFDLEPSLTERTKAAEALAKRTIDIKDRDKTNKDALDRLDEVLKQIGGVV